MASLESVSGCVEDRVDEGPVGILKLTNKKGIIKATFATNSTMEACSLVVSNWKADRVEGFTLNNGAVSHQMLENESLCTVNIENDTLTISFLANGLELLQNEFPGFPACSYLQALTYFYCSKNIFPDFVPVSATVRLIPLFCSRGQANVMFTNHEAMKYYHYCSCIIW